jgi:hypothetical protein
VVLIENQASLTLRIVRMSAESVAEFVEQFLPEQYALALAGKPAPAVAVTLGLSVPGNGVWSLTAGPERLLVDRGLSDSRTLTATLDAPDFERLLTSDELRLRSGAPLLVNTRRWDEETLSLVRAMQGSILVRIADPPRERRILLTPGTLVADYDSARCTIECDFADLVGVRMGTQQPMDLFMAGKLRLQGDAQLALALGGLLL